MPHVAAPIPIAPDPVPHRKRWTRRECEFLMESGLLVGRYELVDGAILQKRVPKPSRSCAIGVLAIWLTDLFGALYVRPRAPIGVAAADEEHNEPEPDSAVTAQPAAAFATRHPAPEDLLLVVEVSDTTLSYDLSVKAALYARAGIREYWVVDISGRKLYVHRQPAAEGYMNVIAYEASEMAATLARPESAVSVADLLPPTE